jgi:hypothetical protein
MPPTDRFVISFAAEPPQESLPYGRWAQTLGELFVEACRGVDTEGQDIGLPSQIHWFPDRTYEGRTYVPATARTEQDYEFYGFVSYVRDEDGEHGGEPEGFIAYADFTEELADNNPDWRIDLNDWVIGSWRGEEGKTADMTLVWGVPQIPSGVTVTAELANLAVDQCPLVEERFTLVAPDNYRGDYLDVKLWNARGNELAVESLYVEGDEDDEEPEASDEPEADVTDEEPGDSETDTTEE